MNTAQAVQEKPEAKSNKVYKIALTGLFAALRGHLCCLRHADFGLRLRHDHCCRLALFLRKLCGDRPRQRVQNAVRPHVVLCRAGRADRGKGAGCGRTGRRADHGLQAGQQEREPAPAVPDLRRLVLEGKLNKLPQPSLLRGWGSFLKKPVTFFLFVRYWGERAHESPQRRK